MSFNPRLFIDVAKSLDASANAEEYYRSVINRAYYGAFGYLKNKLNFPDYGASSHQKLIDNLLAYNDRDHKLVGKKLESLFLKRKIADYKYHEEVKSHSCQYCIQEAEAIISLFNKIQTTP